MAAKTITVGDVTTAGKRVGRVGKGQTPHFLTDATEAACNGKTANPADDFNAEVNLCKTCAKLFTAATNHTTQESTDMAKNTETTKSADEIYAEVSADVEVMIGALGKMTKADADKIKATFDQGEAELKKLTANKRAGLIMRLKNAKAEAENRTSTAIIKAETTSVEEIENYAEIVDAQADAMVAGIKAEVGAQETARMLAENILDARLRVTDKKGRPDLKGTRQASKDLTTMVKQAAEKKLLDSGYATNIAHVEELLDGLGRKITYQMSAVLPEFVRALDNSPEQFNELFPMYADKVSEDMPASELIFKEYVINPKSQAERQRERNALKAGNGSAGEVTGGSGEGEGEGEGEGSGGTGEKSQFEKDTAKLEKIGKDLVSVLGHADEYDDEQKEALRKKITDALTKLSDALTKL